MHAVAISKWSSPVDFQKVSNDRRNKAMASVSVSLLFLRTVAIFGSLRLWTRVVVHIFPNGFQRKMVFTKLDFERGPKNSL